MTDTHTEALVERAIDPMLADLRDRRLLKWLFSEKADTEPVPIGYIDGPIDIETQREICRSLARAAIEALPARNDERALKLVEALMKVRAGYVSQMKFCDIEAMGYFREFVRRIDAALADTQPSGETR